VDIIDVHTHFYPDDIAADAVRALTKPGEFEACGDGTAAGLRSFMRQDGIALSVNLPVATRKEQVRGINRRMIAFNAQNSGEIFCFGTMHPEFFRIGDIREEICFLKDNGIRGIKMHPDYQQFYPDEPRMAAVYEACRDYGLVISFHAGFDFPFPDLTHGTPERFHAVTTIPGLKVILAHLGGYRFSEGVLKHLAGRPVWFDTAFTSGMDPALAREIILNHGPDRILFGSDFPWQRAGAIRRKIEQAVPEPALREAIFHVNARNLLGLTAGDPR
jgi:predicted TIM-barrel fold metal-dependent hydrolase